MTQHYARTDVVLAWPMVLTQGRHEDGFMVRSEGGLPTWVGAEEFAANYIPLGHLGGLPPHLQEAAIELAQLGVRIEKLRQELESHDSGVEGSVTMSANQYKLAKTRMAHMTEYQLALVGMLDNKEAVLAKGIPLATGTYNLAPYLTTGGGDFTDSISKMDFVNVRTTEGYSVKFKAMASPVVDGRCINFQLSLGADQVNMSLDFQRLVLKVSSTNPNIALYADAEVTFDNSNRRS